MLPTPDKDLLLPPPEALRLNDDFAAVIDKIFASDMRDEDKIYQLGMWTCTMVDMLNHQCTDKVVLRAIHKNILQHMRDKTV